MNVLTIWRRIANFPKPPVTEASPVTDTSSGTWRALRVHGVNYITNLRKQTHLAIMINQLRAAKKLVSLYVKLKQFVGKAGK